MRNCPVKQYIFPWHSGQEGLTGNFVRRDIDDLIKSLMRGGAMTNKTRKRSHVALVTYFFTLGSLILSVLWSVAFLAAKFLMP